MVLRLLISAAIICGLSGVFCFVQFIRYRVKEEEKKEKQYKQLHYIFLFTLFAIGIVIMFYLSAQP